MTDTSPLPWRMEVLKTVVVIRDAEGATVANLPITGVYSKPKRVADAHKIITVVNGACDLPLGKIIPLQVVQRVRPLRLVP